MSGQQVPWPNSKKEYELKEIIGVGATAVVHAAYCKPRQEKCAIKIINLENQQTEVDELFKEIQAMASCRHENVVSYYTSFVDNDELWLVQDLLEGGSLLDIIKHKMKDTNCKQGVFDESEISTVLKEVLKGLEYIHKNGQIHRDIKAGNILLGEDGTVQMADFGVSAFLATSLDSSGQKVRHTFVGTPCWMAPEVLDQDNGYDFKADIWSFGITAIEMATGTAPYHKYPPLKVIMLTLQNDPPTLDTGSDDKTQFSRYGKTFRKMITSCLQKDPKKRPTATELLKHPFFKKAMDRKYIQQNLIDIGPSLGTAIYCSPNRNSTIVSYYKTETGKWVWPFEENKDPSNKIESFESPKIKTKGGISHSDIDLAKTGGNFTTLKFVLRLRNAEKELNDIRFEFVSSKDSVEDIVSDMEKSGLVHPSDTTVIAATLHRVINSGETMPSVTFPLASGQCETVSEEALVGFANISVFSEKS